jgi:hypothetical protein
VHLTKQALLVRFYAERTGLLLFVY